MKRPPAPSRRKMTKAQRRDFYNAAKGNNEFPKCNLCPHWVLPGQKWVVSHVPVPHAWEGQEVGVAHKRCNDLYWRQIEAPMMAKARSQYDMARDIDIPLRPFNSRGKDWVRTPDGRVLNRRTRQPYRG